MAADNASNNATTVQNLTQLITGLAATITSRWDGTKAQIRCLPHIIHLAVMALLKNIKAIPEDTPTDDFDTSDMTEEDAEAIAPDGPGREIEQDDASDTVDASVDLQSAIAKVRSAHREAARR